nr:DNA-binding protein [Devosia sp. 1635]
MVWGARAIARLIGKTERATFAMLEAGYLPGARKVGIQWVVSRSALAEHFGVAA